MKVIKISGFGSMDEYEIISHGNGWAYQIVRKEDGDSMWLQDEDASEFRAKFDKADVSHVNYEAYTIADLCNEYFYL